MLTINPKEMRLNSILILSIICFSAAQAQNRQGSSLPKNSPSQDRICFALYTVHENILKLTAQFYPIKASQPYSAVLQLRRDKDWETVQQSPIIYPGYTAHFRLEDWDDSQEVEYRVAYNNKAFYEGIIRQNPLDKEEIIMAAFSCWSIQERHGGNEPVQDIIDNLNRLKPDLLFFAGDQVYDHSQHLNNWLKFGETFGELIRNTPTITIPDDHDIGQGNLWGNGGKKIEQRNGRAGGYFMPVSYIKEVERAQTSHLPDPYDPTPIERGIGVYYTDLTWGGISFAILEDRKFKSGPDRVLEKKRYDNTYELDVDGATLLGQRQLNFLADWTTDWKGAEMKAVLSQTIFANLITHSPTLKDKRRYSVDSNGWPQTGRNKALSIIRKSYACMIGGDQHLGSVIHHGIEDWNNAGYSFAIPAAANLWMRYWLPDSSGKNRKAGSPNYTGEFEDPLHNKITVYAVANPSHEDNSYKEDLLDGRAAGYGIVRFQKAKREITFECWPRNVDMFASGSKPYPGWPVVFNQTDNFMIQDGFELPTLKISKTKQVVTVLDHFTGEVISSLRIQGDAYQPKVQYPGRYKIVVGEGEAVKYLYDQAARRANLEVVFVDMDE